MTESKMVTCPGCNEQYDRSGFTRTLEVTKDGVVYCCDLCPGYSGEVVSR